MCHGFGLLMFTCVAQVLRLSHDYDDLTHVSTRDEFIEAMIPVLFISFVTYLRMPVLLDAITCIYIFVSMLHVCLVLWIVRRHYVETWRRNYMIAMGVSKS